MESKSENQDSDKIKEYIVHKPLTYGKKFYLIEFLAEKTIKFLAFLSIAIIVAIFYFVFNEAKYAFEDYVISEESYGVAGSVSGSASNQESTTLSETYTPETYKPNEGTADASKPAENNAGQYKPEQYNPNEQATSETKTEVYKPEQYNPNETSTASQEEVYKPETYNPNESQAQSADATSNQNAEQTTDLTSVENTDLPMKKVDPSLLASYSVMDFFVPNDTIEGKSEYIWQPISERPKYSIIPLFVGSLKLTTIGILIAAPIAILAAIFTSMFAPRRLKEIIKPAIEILAGFPSVVLGFFCLITLASVIQNYFDSEFRLNALVGGIGISLAVIPIIYTITEDALAAVPKHLKEASLAMGASLWQTAFRVVLPAAIPGVFAAIILGFGRAFGETMIALMATGNAALISADIFEPIRTMAATVGAEMAEVEHQGVHYGILFLIGALLFVITFTLNAVAEFYVRKKLIKRFSGK
jgi:phosphate transport system permease protein